MKTRIGRKFHSQKPIHGSMNGQKSIDGGGAGTTVVLLLLLLRVLSVIKWHMWQDRCLLHLWSFEHPCSVILRTVSGQT